MIRTVLLVVVALVAVLLVYAATKPNDFRIQRSATIKAPPAKIFPFIDDFHQWTAWSPYEKMDPTMQRSYSGAEKGKGAVYAWEGNGKAGAGRMEITASSASSAVAIDLDFTKPFQSHCAAQFTFEPHGDATTVTWAMTGTDPYLAKVMTTFFNRDRMVGGDFEVGLANLKTLSEK